MKCFAILLAAALCLTGCRGNSSEQSVSVPETTGTAAPVSGTAATTGSTEQSVDTHTESTASAAESPAPISFQDLLSESGAHALTEFTDSVIAMYVRQFTTDAQSDGDFTVFGASKQLSNYLVYAASRESTQCAEDDPFLLTEVQTKKHSSYILQKGILSNRAGTVNNGSCSVIIGEQDGRAVLLDLIRNGQGAADALKRPEQVISPDPDFWSNPDKWKLLMQKAGLDIGVTETTKIPDYPIHSPFEEPLSEADTAVLTDFVNAVARLYEQYNLFSHRPESTVKPEHDFTEYGATEQLNKYMIYSSSKEDAVFPEFEEFDEVQFKLRGTYAVVTGDGGFHFVIGARNGQAYLMDTVKWNLDLPDAYYRQDMIQNPVPGFWSDPFKWQPLMRRLGLR